MNRQLESSIENKAVDKIFTKLGVTSLKLNVKGNTGWPDRIFFLPNRNVFFIEFKRPGEEARKKQLYIHKILQALGFRIEVHDDADQAFEAVRRELAAALLPEKGRKMAP